MIEFKNEGSWIKDDHRKYLWIHDELPIQAMIFSNDNEPEVKCLWIKTLNKGEFVSNYFVYSTETDKIHPLDYAIELVQKFKDNELENDDR